MGSEVPSRASLRVTLSVLQGLHAFIIGTLKGGGRGTEVGDYA